MSETQPVGPLHGVRVVEAGGIGPVPLAGMLLADLGAEVIRVDRPAVEGPLPFDRDLSNRGKHSVLLDLKDTDDVGALRRLIAESDALIEGFRPGVMERMGLGPAECQALNPALVYGRMTGWGQSGPLASAAGHDLNYISIAGAIGLFGGGADRSIPLNLIGDYGGGALYLVVGVLAALHEARLSGRGQVVDGAIVDGVAHLLTAVLSMINVGHHSDPPGSNLLDGGAPFYAIYETADGEFVSVGAIEPQFYENFLLGLGLDPSLNPQHDRSRWAVLRAEVGDRIRRRTTSEIEELFAGVDACVTPVLTPSRAARHPHVRDRGSLVEFDGELRPGRAPRLERYLNAPIGAIPQRGDWDAEFARRYRAADGTRES